MDDTNKIIQDAFNSLDPATKAALGKVPWKERVRNIANREKLSNDKASVLENEALMLLYNLTVPEGFASNISDQLDLDVDTSNRIAKEIFDEIVTDLEKAYESSGQPNGNNLPEVLPNEKVHEVTHIEIKKSPTPPPAPSSPTPPAPPPEPALKPNLASIPTYAEPAQIGPEEDKNKRPDLSFPESSYNQGQDPYREPLE
jgi:hypothetical protein